MDEQGCGGAIVFVITFTVFMVGLYQVVEWLIAIATLVQKYGLGG